MEKIYATLSSLLVNEQLIYIAVGIIVFIPTFFIISRSKPFRRLLLGKDYKEYVGFREESKRLREELHRRSGILNNVGFAIWRRDETLAIKYCNLAYNQIIEENLEEGTASEDMELYAEAKNLADLALKTSKQQEGRKHIIVLGERRFFQITELPYKDGTIGFACDITELEEKEKELKHNTAVQSDLMESSASAIAIYGSDTKLKFFNNAFVNLWKINEIWLSSQPTYSEILELLREKRRLPEQANFPQFKKDNLAMFTNLIEKHEEIYYLPDGKVLRALVIPHEHGGLLFSYEDMTDQIALERSYNTLLSVNKSTIDNLSEGVVVFREDGRLQLCNPAYLDIWNLDLVFTNSEPHLSEILEETKKLYDYFDNWNSFKEKIISLIGNRESFRQRLSRKDGSILQWSCIPLPDGAILMTYVDITDSTRVEQSLRAEKDALREADNIKTNFLTNVSYELRSPLTSIKGFSEILLEDFFGKLNEKQKEYVKGIFDSSLQLASLIDNILDVSYIDAGYMTLDIAEFAIGKMLDQSAKMLADDMAKAGIRLKVKYSDSIGSMYGDEKRIKQIIINLLINSMHMTPEGGKIDLSAKTKGKNTIVITIKDTGKGIAKENIPYIFDKFHMMGNNSGSGTGLGLTVAKSFIDLHGGTITLESSPEKGTKYVCTFKRKNSDFINSDKKARK